jgi:hypothetical protein
MTRAMPSTPKGRTVEQLDAWQREVLAPWVDAERRRVAQRVHNGRRTGREFRRIEQRAELRAWFAERVSTIDRATLLANLDEVDPAEMLDSADYDLTQSG